MNARFLAVLLFSFGSGGSTGKAKVTPIQKVVELLRGLQNKISEEGKHDADTYDKYACFCKEQSNEKQAEIKLSESKIAKLRALIEGGNSRMTEANGKIAELNKQVSGEQNEVEKQTEKRQEEHAGYLAKAADLANSIKACEAAREALQDAKASMVDAKVNLLQVHSRLAATTSKHEMTPKAMSLFGKLGQEKQEPAKYKFKSNDIIEELYKEFKSMKVDLDNAEREIQAMFDSKTLGLGNQMKFQNKEKGETESLVASLSEQVAAARQSLEEEEQEKATNEEFLKTLTADCEGKATLFDQRSQARAGELTAMTKAITILEAGVNPNEDANKAVFFLQFHTLQQKSNAVVHRVESDLQVAGKRLKSVMLRTAAIRVQVSGDDFVKVRELIKDLQNRVKEEAKAEADAKGFCDEKMKEAITSRDQSQANQEVAEARLATLARDKAQLQEDIETLAADISGKKKANLESEELRARERSDNNETVQSAKEGKLAVENARTVLSQFYEGQTSLLQRNTMTSAQSIRRDAPQTFSNEYHGAKAESKGIVGMLEVIASDFDRTIHKTEDDEAQAQADFEALRQKNNEAIATMTKTSAEKEAKLKSTEADIVEQQDDLKDAQALLKGALEKLAQLKLSCAEGREDFKERAEKRQKELAALKTAQATLGELMK